MKLRNQREPKEAHRTSASVGAPGRTAPGRTTPASPCGAGPQGEGCVPPDCSRGARPPPGPLPRSGAGVPGFFVLTDLTPASAASLRSGGSGRGPPAVALDATGSASARPSAVTRPGSPNARTMIVARRLGPGLRQLVIGRELHRVDRLVVGVADHLHRPLLAPSAPAPMRCSSVHVVSATPRRCRKGTCRCCGCARSASMRRRAR